MKRLVVVLLSVAALALAGEWKGAISDAHCGAKHADGKGKKCVEGCVKKGAAPVFVSDGKVFTITNPDKVQSHLGDMVTVTGNLDGDKLTVDSVKAE